VARTHWDALCNAGETIRFGGRYVPREARSCPYPAGNAPTTRHIPNIRRARTRNVQNGFSPLRTDKLFGRPQLRAPLHPRLPVRIKTADPTRGYDNAITNSAAGGDPGNRPERSAILPEPACWSVIIGVSSVIVIRVDTGRCTRFVPKRYRGFNRKKQPGKTFSNSVRRATGGSFRIYRRDTGAIIIIIIIMFATVANRFIRGSEFGGFR